MQWFGILLSLLGIAAGVFFLCLMIIEEAKRPNPIGEIQAVMRDIEKRWELSMETDNERALLENRPPPYGPEQFVWMGTIDRA